MFNEHCGQYIRQEYCPNQDITFVWEDIYTESELTATELKCWYHGQVDINLSPHMIKEYGLKAVYN